MILLEGFDGAGKSTLAKMLTERSGFPVLHPGAPPQDPMIELNMMRRQLMRAGESVIQDRATCISQQVYRDRLFDPWYMEFVDNMVRCYRFVLIYCRPSDEALLDFSRHKVQPHDSQEMIDHYRNNADRFVKSYDHLMSKVAHVVYDYERCDWPKFIDEVLRAHR